jgi:probable O-glycosylation ligase (exosortase A-associated)
LFVAGKRKLPPLDGTAVACGMFLVWMTFNNVFAVDPSSAWLLWGRNWMIFALALVLWVTATSKIRIHAVIWVSVICLFYYGVKGGFLSILYGGFKTIDGPPGTLIGDNNHLAVALLMILPLANYLRLHTANIWLRIALVAGFALTFLAVVGSYSRGAFLALAALGVVSWIYSRNKIIYAIFGVALAVPVFYFMPGEYYERLATLNDTDVDGSFQGRVQAWQVAYFYARDHFPFGAGFDGPELSSVYQSYFPGEAFRAAHSIYFQVLGDTGFIGLGIYLAILLLAFLNCWRIRKATRGKPELTWARDLATMIQLSLVAFCVGGAALSLAYYDMALVWAAGILPALWKLVRQTAAQPDTSGVGKLPFASSKQAG